MFEFGSGGGDSQEAGFLLDDNERELNLYRSGSAPPTVNNSLAAVEALSGESGVLSEFLGIRTMNGFKSEEEMRSDPAYLSYYYSNVNLNPRLPQPLLSKEDWRVSKRVQGGSSVLGGIGDRRKSSHAENGRARVPYGRPPGFVKVREEGNGPMDNGTSDWDSDGLIGLSGLGIGMKQKSLAEIFQDDLVQPTVASGNSSDDPSIFRRELSSHTLEPAAANHDLSAVADINEQYSYTYAAALGSSLSRSTTPDVPLVARVPSPHLGPIGKGFPVSEDKRAVKNMKSHNGVSFGGSECPELLNSSSALYASFSAMNLTNGVVHEEKHGVDVSQSCLPILHDGQDNTSNEQYHRKSLCGNSNASLFKSNANVLCPDVILNGVNEKGSSSLSPSAGRNVELQRSAPGNGFVNLSSPNFDRIKDHTRYNFNGYYQDQSIGPTMNGQFGIDNGRTLCSFDDVNVPPVRVASAMESRGCFANRMNLNKLRFVGADSVLQQSCVDPIYLQHLRGSECHAAHVKSFNDAYVNMDYVHNSYVDIFGLQKAYFGGLISPHKVHCSNKSMGPVNGIYENHTYDTGMLHCSSPLPSPYVRNSFVGPGSPIMNSGFNMNFPVGVGNPGVVMSPWHVENELDCDGCLASSLLQEFKNNKAKCFELSEIAGHVVEFSADQYGSRFIQQKLETAIVGERDMVFGEIMPHAMTLMTDVFGNYVVQKFLEHGATLQRRELANKLTGHVLSLSLQMYGCRVIQKAIEVVDVDQKIAMVGELEGHVMRCVRDQNGNHVIQKCIECVPEDSIQFIITTFFGQIIALSTHPYGCRVIQRILEHCKDPNTQSHVMDEILGSVSMLTQDQYGNYVIQHVLEHGKPQERSAIINELAGKVLAMSQQKFASNVMEKCLSFGCPSERQLLVTEILGSTDENEPLQVMMKDQFANYVVQKVLETCDDHQREIILARIKVHLNALKKYTYGKHIVARVEKLVISGERRSVQSMHVA